MKVYKLLILVLMAASFTVVCSSSLQPADAGSLTCDHEYCTHHLGTTNYDGFIPFLRVTFVTSNPEEWVQQWLEDIDACIAACIIEEADCDIPHKIITIEDLDAGLSSPGLFEDISIAEGVIMNAHIHAWGAWSDWYDTGQITHRKCIGKPGDCQLLWAKYRYCLVPGYGCGATQAEYVWSDLLPSCT